MHPSLQPFEDRVKLGLIRKCEQDGLILYNYTDKCTYERAWDEYTLKARGIIFHKDTGKVIALTLPKFFNIFENEASQLENLPSGPCEVFNKVDGSMVAIWHYNGKWHTSTRGSFNSDQAIMAQTLLSKYDMSSIRENITIIAEVVYPANKIIVDYGDTTGLFFLAAMDRYRGTELMRHETILAAKMGMLKAGSPPLNFHQALASKSTLDKNIEGYVVRWENGLRVKIKGDEYLRIAKIMSNLSPLSLWETMTNGRVDDKYIQQLPEELRPEMEAIKDRLELKYKQTVMEIETETRQVETNIQALDKVPSFREIGLYIKENRDTMKHPNGIFPWLNHRDDKYVMLCIRPKGNVLE